MKTSVHLVILTFCSLFAKAQHTINSCGGSAQINGMSFHYSIGEMTLINTAQNPNLIVTQGFLQPIGSENAAMANPANTISTWGDVIKVYPNPTENILNVESVENVAVTINYQLLDALGKIIQNKEMLWKAGPNLLSLDLRPYAAGTYYLIIQKPNPVGTIEKLSFKIQKSN
jgi:hypothetical protein